LIKNGIYDVNKNALFRHNYRRCSCPRKKREKVQK